MFEIGGRPGLRVLWALFPPVLFVLLIILRFDRAKRFNRHRAFGLGLWFLNIIFICILAFDKSITYTPKQ
ncbi:DUF5684 domain-containing protein [Candidatus Gracilibacteria bacterium]|nr:DUF5684 domain-containing protein [Candidatus Gracilibacteria bacterium]